MSAEAAFDEHEFAPDVHERQGVVDRVVTFLGRRVSHHLTDSIETFEGDESEPVTRMHFSSGSLRCAIDVDDPDALMASVVRSGDVGLLDAYVRGEWRPVPELSVGSENLHIGHSETDAFVTAMRTLIRKRRDSGFESVRDTISNMLAVGGIRDRFLSKKPSGITADKEDVEAHYNRWHQLLEGDGSILGKAIQFYSCGVWDSETPSLEEANREKAVAVRERLDLRPGMHLLEIGGGYGALALDILENTDDVHITILVTASEQKEYLDVVMSQRGFGDRVKILEQDYRDHDGAGQYDRVYSMEVVEHNSWQDLQTFVDANATFLKRTTTGEIDGKVVMQAILVDDEHYERYKRADGWLKSRVFPGGNLPSRAQLVAKGFERHGMHVRSEYDMTDMYPPQLLSWMVNLLENHGEQLSPEELRWQIAYLGSCAAAFAERHVLDRLFEIEPHRQNPSFPGMRRVTG